MTDQTSVRNPEIQASNIGRWRRDFSLSPIHIQTVWVGGGDEHGFAGERRSISRTISRGVGLLSQTATTLLLYGAQSVHNTRVEVTLLCTVSAHKMCGMEVSNGR